MPLNVDHNHITCLPWFSLSGLRCWRAKVVQGVSEEKSSHSHGSKHNRNPSNSKKPGVRCCCISQVLPTMQTCSITEFFEGNHLCKVAHVGRFDYWSFSVQIRVLILLKVYNICIKRILFMSFVYWNFVIILNKTQLQVISYLSRSSMNIIRPSSDNNLQIITNYVKNNYILYLAIIL